MQEYEDGTLSRGDWKLEDSTLSYCCESFEQARAIKAELQSLGGSKLEADGAFLYAAIESDPESAEHSEQALAAVRELRGAGFGVSGDLEAEPFLFHVETQGRKATDQGTLRLRFATALEDEARERYNALREAPDVQAVHLSRFDPSDGLRAALECCESIGEGDSLATLALSGKVRGELYEVSAGDLEGYSALGYSSLHRRARSEESVAESMREGRARFVFVSEYATGSDYGGHGAVSKSNLRALRELAEAEGLAEGSDFWELDGAHGTYGIAFRAGLRCAALSEAFLALEDYPLLDEDLHSEIECEEDSEAWDSYVRSDFQNTLGSRESLDLSEVSGEAMLALFETARERSNTYFEHSSEGASIDVDRVAQAVTRAELLALEGCAREDEAEQAGALALLAQARPAFDKLEDEAEAEPSERAPNSLPEAVEAVRVALGAPPEQTIRDCAYFLSQVSRWPIGQNPLGADATPEQLRAELVALRRNVGSVAQAARMRLAELDPKRSELERASYSALPIETPKLD